jgi:hypothetical protein
MTKKDIMIMIIEIACCLIGALPVRLILTVVKNLLKMRNADLIEEI